MILALKVNSGHNKTNMEISNIVKNLNGLEEWNIKQVIFKFFLNKWHLKNLGPIGP